MPLDPGFYKRWANRFANKSPEALEYLLVDFCQELQKATAQKFFNIFDKEIESCRHLAHCAEKPANVECWNTTADSLEMLKHRAVKEWNS